MERKDEELIQTLLDRDPELRRYYEEHVDTRAAARRRFQHKHYLSPEEEVEKKRLQKLKLAGKDRIMEILSRAHRARTERGPMRHTISVLVENEFGVLARVAGLFSGRGVQHREPVGRRDARSDRLPHHAGHPRRRPGARADRASSSTSWCRSSR